MADRPDVFQGVKENSYSLDRFYVRATNDHDHSASVRLALPKDQLAIATKFVQMGVISEYRTVQDPIRDGLHHRLEWLAEKIGDFEAQEVLSVQRGLADLSQRRAHLAEQQDFIEGVEKLMREYSHSFRYEQMLAYADELEMEHYDLDHAGVAELHRVLTRARTEAEAGLRRAEQ